MAPCVEDDLELLDREVGIGEGDVGREPHPLVDDEADFLVHPAVEGADVRVERLDVVGELVLDVVRGGGEHERLVDALFVHQRQAQVAVAERFRLVAELGDERLALFVTQPLERVEAVQQHAGHDAEIGLALFVRHRAAAGADLGGVAEHLLELVLRERHLVAVELRRLAREQLHPLALGRPHRANREVDLRRVDVALEAVVGLVEVVVGVVDRIRKRVLGHAVLLRGSG